ncbi:hypothetical protein GCM10009415_07840 [Chitinophaga japonensis]
MPVYQGLDEFRASVKSEAPREIEHPGKIYLYGQYIFLNELNKGIHIIDNSNPAAPDKFAFISIPGNVDMAVKNNILYADSYIDLVALDISDPHSVKVSKRLENIFPERIYEYGIQSDTGDNLLIIDFVIKDTVLTAPCDQGHAVPYLYDMASNSAMVEFSSTASKSAASVSLGKSGSLARFALLNNYLYTVNNYGLQAFEVQNPSQPAKRNNITIGWGIETIFPYNNHLFIGSMNGVFIYDASNPAYPVQKGSFSHVQSCDPVVVENNLAYVTLRGGNACGGFENQLDVLDVADLSNPKLLKSYPMSSPYGLGIDAGKLFICEGSYGLKFLDAQDAGNISTVKWLEGIDAYDVIPHNNVLLVTAKDGLYQYNYSNLQEPVLLSKLPIIVKE